MAINYITKDNGLFDQKINQGLLTAALGVPDVQLVNGGRSFTLTTLSTSGLKPHTRNKGFNTGSAENEKKVYTMGQDRDIEFYVDTQDVDETNQDLAVGNISKVFIQDHVQPEIDAYRFSTLAKGAGHSTTETLTVDNVYTQLKAALLPVRKFGAQNIIGFVSSEVMDFLERSKDTRFKSDYDFSDGYVPAEDAADINFILVAKQAVIPVVKENAIFLFAPGQHTQGDGYLYQNRLYHDLFIKEQQKDGVSVSLKG